MIFIFINVIFKNYRTEVQSCAILHKNSVVSVVRHSENPAVSPLGYNNTESSGTYLKLKFICIKIYSTFKYLVRKFILIIKPNHK